MPALPADGTVRAAARWWQLLGRSSLSQAWAIIRADAAYTDLTPTQYAAALDWLQTTGMLVRDPAGLVPNHSLRGLPHRQVTRVLFQRGLEEAQPAWLPDADVLIPDSTELPQDAVAFANSLNLAASDAFLAVSHAQRKVDLERRAAVGAAGELLLAERLDRQWPGRVSHVSLNDDGLGFDIVLTHEAGERHLEVKTTTRRGRLVVYLSRHEFEVSRMDPDWRMVVVGLAGDGDLAAVATVRPDVPGARAPRDQHWAGRWESVRLELVPEDLERGLPFLAGSTSLRDPVLLGEAAGISGKFSWLPAKAPVEALG